MSTRTPIPRYLPALGNKLMGCCVLQAVAMDKSFFAPLSDKFKVEWLTEEEIAQRQRKLLAEGARHMRQTPDGVIEVRPEETA